MEPITLYPKSKEQASLFEQLAKVLNVPFEKGKTPYDPKFAEEILQAKQDIKDGKGVKIKTEDLWK